MVKYMGKAGKKWLTVLINGNKKKVLKEWKEKANYYQVISPTNVPVKVLSNKFGKN